ncbi:Tim44/TimA family putative adaptor protein [Pseudogemmobacter faecipullorum]|uniref:Tim44 domain-containing protein n=1 Tax=Pseudogemmobacter faecipullorum TaxID=2755041 RepID=A0ABS8CH96_9RHOB|nr:Tim44/TimA family putative adaptor protein [Pseudogemmobacter faecipullorum]MCB5408757.1 Tim44 domain-containing protein [Pseudogemmobacter faecipullorum]
MNSALIQLLVLAGIAVFLILKLRSLLGTRDGFEKKPLPPEAPRAESRREFEVIEGGPDRDITDHVAENSASAKALAAMKAAEPSFALTPFLSGARQAYEMILMAFERGEMDQIRSFLSDDVEAGFEEVIRARKERGLVVEANFVGLKEMALQEAVYDKASGFAELTVRFIGELTSVVRDQNGEIVEGDSKTVKRQRDVWTFARKMGDADPNWQLVATGE